LTVRNFFRSKVFC